MFKYINIPPQLDGEKEGILYYTDEPEVFRRLKSKGDCVLPVLSLKSYDSDEEKRELHLKDKKPDISVKEDSEKDTFSISESKYAITDPDSMDITGFTRLYRRLKNLPWLITSTKRTVIREITESDADMIDILNRRGIIEKGSDPIAAHQGVEPLPLEKDKLLQYIADYRHNVYEFYEYGIWAVVDKETGQIIGRAGLEPSADHDYPDLGYMIAPEFRNKGYAFEVCSAIIEYAKEELFIEKIGAKIAQDNAASQKLIKKLGFKEHKPLQGNYAFSSIFQTICTKSIVYSKDV